MNVAIDLQRKRKRERLVFARDDADNSPWIEQLPSPDLSPEQRLQQVQLAQQIQDVLDAMKPKHRIVFALREIDGLSYEEIGELRGLPVRTVESRLHRARQKFQDKMKRLQSL